MASYPYPQTTFTHTTFGPSLLSARRRTVSKTTIHAQLQKLRETGRYDCFKLEWHPTYDDHSMWPVPLHLFWDSDVAKWIEGACYFLEEEYDEEVDKAIKELVDMIRSAQQEDGYLNVHYTVVEKGKRWTNLRDMHELYNAGHLIEAALAHKHYYKNDLFLEAVAKYVALIRRMFGPAHGQRRGYPGHPEIELALLRMYAATGNQDAYDLAHFFLSERGNPRGQEGKHYYDWESEQRGDDPYKRPDTYPRPGWYEYCQAHRPILEQDSVEGHAVRQMYLLTAVADMAELHRAGVKSLDGEDGWRQALDKCWRNMVERKMYLTGGIGAIKQWEGFGIDYFLPQGTDEGGCYSETCAAIGVIMLAERLLRLDLDGRYADAIELCLYNAVMTAMSVDGRAFTYVNQLASSDADKNAREDWFWCACCPPNVTRLLGSLGGYVWHFTTKAEEAAVNVHLYTAAKLEFGVEGGKVTLEQKTRWPHEGTVMFQLGKPADTDVTLRLRVPAWAKGNFSLIPTPELQPTAEKGYITLPPSYTAANPAFALIIGGFKPRWMAPHPYTGQRTLTLGRGPIVYCAEDADNEWETSHFKDVVVNANSAVEEIERICSKTGESYTELRCACSRRELALTTSLEWAAGTETRTASEEKELILIPYYFRANRGGNGHMRVGFQKL